MRAQLRAVDAARARFALIIGDDEAASGTAALKHMAGGEQMIVPLDGLPAAIHAAHEDR
jgi:histidyl-tRNA synthetase